MVTSVGVCTPFGPLVARASEDRITSIRFDWDSGPAAMAAQPSPTGVLACLSEQLERYVAGDTAPFDLLLAWDRVDGLRRAVLEATAAVPAGQVTTYGDIAVAIGRPGEARAVGGALRSNPWVLVVPCHRVVAADGALTGYGGGPRRGGRLDVKAALLAHEGRPTQGSLFGPG